MRKGLVTAMATLAAGLGAAGCGQEQVSVVDRAVSQDVRSGELSMAVQFAGGGQAGGVRVTGPFSGGTDTQLGRFDFAVAVAVPGQQPLRGEVISTGADVFVRYGGVLYGVGAARIARFERRSARRAQRGPQVRNLGDLQRLGLDVESWFPQSAGPEDASFAGEPTTRVTGRLDVSAFLRDLGKLLANPAIRAQLGPGAGGPAGAKALGSLTADQIAQIDRVITDPRFEVQVGRADGKFRRVDGSLGFAGAGRLTFDLQLRKVDQPVTIAAPQGRARPIRGLLRRLARLGPAGTRG